MLTLAVGILAFVIGIAVGASAGKTKQVAGSARAGSTVTEAVTQTVTETAQPTSEAPTAADTPTAVPKPADFTITIKTKKQECFGSAGCNVSYQIAPRYIGSADISSGSYSVTYQVTGGESGPQINTFTLADGTASYDQEETIQTASSSTVLKVNVTSVDPS